MKNVKKGLQIKMFYLQWCLKREGGDGEKVDRLCHCGLLWDRLYPEINITSDLSTVGDGV